MSTHHNNRITNNIYYIKDLKKKFYQFYNYDNFLNFVIHMDAARREMKAASCFDIIEFNTQLDTDQLVVGDPPRLPSSEELRLVRRANPDLALTITENYERSLERWLKREAAVAAIKERHEKKLQAVYWIMQKYFGRSVLARVSTFLEELDYYSAWHTLVTYYLKTGLLENKPGWMRLFILFTIIRSTS